MTREEEIVNEATNYGYKVAGGSPERPAISQSFVYGAKWADEHPKNIWHDANEEPQKYPILCHDEFDNIWTQHTLIGYIDGWKEFSEVECITRWAYIKDLLPKGGVRNDT